jgi:hypothetical protein
MEFYRKENLPQQVLPLGRKLSQFFGRLEKLPQREVFSGKLKYSRLQQFHYNHFSAVCF